MGSVVFSSTYSTPMTTSTTYNVRIGYSETYNQSTNATTVAITSVELQKVNNSTNWGSLPFFGTVKVNGVTLLSMSGGSSVRVSLSGSGYCSVAIPSSSTTSITHNADGSKSVSFEIEGGFTYGSSKYFCAIYTSGGTGYPFGAVSQSKTVALTTRPRISSVSATNANFGSPVTITLSRYNSSFTHTVTATCAGRTETIMTKGSTYPTLTWTPSVANFAPLITTAMSATATITCQTYNGSSLIGSSTTTCTLTFTAASVAPSVSIATTDPQGCLATYGKYVKTKSKITVTLTTTLAYGATLKTTNISANGAQYNSSPATTDFISSTSNTGVSATITDSRGQTASASVSIEIYDYSPPTINAFEAHRCNSDGTENNAGGYFLAEYSIVMSPLGNQNTLTNALKVKYKKISASTYTEATKTPAAYTEASAFSPIAVDTNSTYNLTLELTDDFSTTFVSLVLPTAATRMNWGPGENGGIAIGKVNEYDKTLEVADDWDVLFGGDLTVLGTINGGGGGGSSTMYFPSQTVNTATNAEIFRITNAAITTQTVLVECTFAAPASITSYVTWTSYDGYIAFYGTCTAATTADVTLSNADTPTPQTPLAIANGGTGANNAADAVANLGFEGGTGYCKMPDGTLIQWGTTSFTSGYTTGYVTPIYIFAINITVPIPFVDTNYIAFGSGRYSTGMATPIGFSGASSTTSFSGYWWDAATRTFSASLPLNVRWCAIGRWK